MKITTALTYVTDTVIRHYTQAIKCRGKWATIREMTNKGYSVQQIAKVLEAAAAV